LQSTTKGGRSPHYSKLPGSEGEIDKAMAADLQASDLMETMGDQQGIADAYQGFLRF